MMKSIQIECGFFSKETLLATQDGYAQNVSPGENTYVSAVAVGSEPPRNLEAKCRLVGWRDADQDRGEEKL